MSWAAHELESVVLHRHLKVSWRVSYMAVLIGALAPDFVKLPVYGLNIAGHELIKAPDPAEYHRGWPGAGPTHSLLFGVVVAVVVYLVTRSKPWAIGLLLGQWSHALTDTFDSVGSMLFFPFTTQHYSVGMWHYGSQMGRYGDAAAYYSSLGGVWDCLWLATLVLLGRHALSDRYFHEVVEPADPFWDWMRKRLGASDYLRRAIFRAYVVYGVSRIAAWTVWARFVNPNRGWQTMDWSWGGPSWVRANDAVPGARTWPGLALVTVWGLAGVATTVWILWWFVRRWELRRTGSPVALDPVG